MVGVGAEPKRARRMRCHSVRESAAGLRRARVAIGAPCSNGSPLIVRVAIFIYRHTPATGSARRV